MSKVVNQGGCVQLKIDDGDPSLDKVMDWQSNDGFDCVKGTKNTNPGCRNAILARGSRSV